MTLQFNTGFSIARQNIIEDNLQIVGTSTSVIQKTKKLMLYKIIEMYIHRELTAPEECFPQIKKLSRNAIAMHTPG